VRGVVPIVQIDIVMGFLCLPRLAFSTEGSMIIFHRILNEEEGMPFWGDIDFELTLMVKMQVENFDIYTKLGPKKIIFHIEAVGNLESFKNFLEGIDMYIRDSMPNRYRCQSFYTLEQIFP